MHGIARKSALIMFVQILNGLLGYVGLKYIALYMEPWEYGVIGFAYGFVAIFSIFSTLGFDSAHIKRISEGKDAGNCFATFAAIKLILAGLMAIIIIFFIFVWKFLFNRGFETPLHEQAIYIIMAYFVLLTLSQIFTSTFYARKESAKTQIPLFICTFVKTIATILVAVNNLGILALAYTYLIGELFEFSTVLILFKGYPVGKPSLPYFKDYFKFAMPLALASSSYLIMINIDKVFIQLFWGAKQVGEYFAIFNLSNFITVFSSSVSILLLPTISSYHSKDSLDMIKDLTLKAERYISMVIFPLIALLVVLAYPIIHILLSDQYLPAVHILQILPLFVIFDALSGPYTQHISGMDMPRFVRNKLIIMTIVNVFLDLVLIPQDISSIGLRLAGLGSEGAAAATVIAYIVGLIYIRLKVWKISKIKGNKKIVIHVFAAFVMASFLWFINYSLGILRWYQLLGVSLLGIGVYIFVLFLCKEFTKEDLDFFFDTLNIKKMVRYILDEMRIKPPKTR